MPSRAPEFASPNGLWESRFVNLLVADGLTARLRCEAGTGSSCPVADRDVSFRYARIDVVDGLTPLVITGVSTPEPPAQRADSLLLSADSASISNRSRVDRRCTARRSCRSRRTATWKYVRAAVLRCSAVPVIPRASSADLPRATFVDGNLRGPGRALGMPPGIRLGRADLHLSGEFGYDVPAQAAGYQTCSATRPVVVSASFAGSRPSGPSAHLKPPTIQGVVRDEDGHRARARSPYRSTLSPLVCQSQTSPERLGRDRRARRVRTWKVPAWPVARDQAVGSTGLAAGAVATLRTSSRPRSASRRTALARGTGGPCGSPAAIPGRPAGRPHARRPPGLGWPMGPIRGRDRQARAVLGQVHVQAHVSADQLPLPRRPAGRSELPVRRRDVERGTRTRDSVITCGGSGPTKLSA